MYRMKPHRELFAARSQNHKLRKSEKHFSKWFFTTF
jgi:hypothetical protein